MNNHPSSEEKNKSTDPPAPEVLQSQSEDGSSSAEANKTSTTHKVATKFGRAKYRPSHKATFIGLAVVLVILAANAGVIVFVIQSQKTVDSKVSQGEVTLSPAVLDKLGVSRTAVGNLGTELVVGPDSRFNGTLTVGGDVSIGGQLKLNSKLSANDASFTKLEAGDTALGQLNVNGDATVSNLNLRKDLTILGSTRMQGPVVMSQLLTVNNAMNVSGNLAVGGILSARGFQASSLISDTTLTVGGHIITRGSAPGVGPGSALGSNGTVSISGNDVSGTVATNIGTGGGNGILAYVAFLNQYGNIPHVVVTPVGRGMDGFYINRSAGGFSIGVTGAVAPGGYAFDYIVMQ